MANETHKQHGIAVAGVPNTSADDIRRTFELQRPVRIALRSSTAKQRIRKLKALKKAVLSTKHELEQALVDDFRKPPVETDLTETMLVISEINAAVRELRHWMRPQRVGTPMTLLGTRSELRYEPRGTVLIIAPWNYPFQLALAPLVASIAAGNTNIVKPSEFTPHTSAYIKKLIAMVFTEDECAVLEGDHTVSQELLKLPFDHIVFTGSTNIGKVVMEAASKHLSTVTLELGGKSPAIIDDTADLKTAAKRIMWGKFVNGGQTCVAPDYVLIPDDRVDEFVQHASYWTEEYYGKHGAELQQSADFCRIISKKHYQRLTGLLHEAMEGGAKVAMGGETDGDENYIAPTILTGITPDAKIMQEEIFGPILPVLTYRKLEDALAFINERDKPLAMYIFSHRDRTIETMLKATSSGGTVINDTLIHAANHHLPFGGVNHSGHGSYHGFFGFRELSHERAVLRQSRFFSALDLLYPPYTGFAKRVADLTRRFLV